MADATVSVSITFIHAVGVPLIDLQRPIFNSKWRFWKNRDRSSVWGRSRCQSLDFTGIFVSERTANCRSKLLSPSWTVKLKICCPKGRVGSSPTSGTIDKTPGFKHFQGFLYARFWQNTAIITAISFLGSGICTMFQLFLFRKVAIKAFIRSALCFCICSDTWP